MTAVLMDGKAVSGLVKLYVSEEVKQLMSRGVHPKLATVMVGDDPASKIYVSIKHKACEETGIKSENHQLNGDVKEGELLNLIDELNKDGETHGILVQLPLPQSIDSYKVVDRIKPEKDVDGLNPYNMGKLSYKKHTLAPCTPSGIVTLLRYYNVRLAGQHVVIVNRSPLVGKPLMLLTRFDPMQMHLFNADMLFLNEDAVVSICHSKTRDLLYFTRNADILISAVGRRPHLQVTADMVKPGSAVVDVGVSRVDGRIIGDVEFDEVKEKAGYITPNPGGVGPMTVAMLLHNTLLAASNQTGVPLTQTLESFLKKKNVEMEFKP
jgi:methylenetetrahydrofolate dehydrogenase (NADP+)/methenyltetrahydrofolate cyclohydrolase